jgi:hypothetical protein
MIRFRVQAWPAIHFLTDMNGGPFSVVAFALLAGLGLISLSFLFVQFKDRLDVRRERAEAPPAGAVLPLPGEASSEFHTEEGESGTREEAGSGAAPPSRASAGPGSSERRRLQRLLNRGVALMTNTPDIFGIAGASLLTPTTKPEDVDAWEAAVEGELWERPRDLALFHYERPKSPLAALGASAALRNPLKERLQARVAQLETIVKRTP